MSTPAQKAKERFDEYAGHSESTDHLEQATALQVDLFRWQTRNFGAQDAETVMLGVVEEVGELSHALLKHKQAIRGMADHQRLREDAGDAIADTVIYLTQICTSLRLDFWTLYEETARNVMKRDWRSDPDTGGEQ